MIQLLMKILSATLMIFLSILGIVVVKVSDDPTIVLSSIRGEYSKLKSVNVPLDDEVSDEVEVTFLGDHADFFSIKKMETSKGALMVDVQFTPSMEFIGLAEAVMEVTSGDELLTSMSVRGLSTKALEGENEPPLALVVQALGWNVDLGWTDLANHTKSELQGDELLVKYFRKAEGAEMVEMIPVARYSPPFMLPFGYYEMGNEAPVLEEVGVLANSGSYPEHQTLFPSLEKGQTSFDPGTLSFGFYTTSPSHVAYSEDSWNQSLHPDHAVHACRVYAVKDHEGKLVDNQYLVCFEEAANGDYQDYVFLVKHVVAK
ncbi:hypothetical protein FKX85_06880 [Echinicola soli]|uniref:Uncharacterized protein n=1 Tax=Echinicola soli TaxID=2591634 RepID=A0A514CG38_9BACT|nr:hypothetical protein [Echinicola soli]QDH78772.1 hypothetical protein FKX85_06880 [Echinicola soli]